MAFIDELQEIIKGDPEKYGGSSEEDFTLSTGFMGIDYLNGQLITKDDGKKQVFKGVSAGRMCMIIGKSGTGKTTLAVQMGINIIKRYTNGLMYVFDYEKNNTRERIRQVTGITEEYFDKHISIQRQGISTQTLIRTLSQIKAMKLAHKDELLVDNENNILDKNGKVIKVLPPTVVIVDSVAMMLPEDNLAEEDIQGSMAATATAKVNSQLMKKVIPILDAANIVLFMINHITQQVTIGPTPVAADINYLKQGEALPGGKSIMYLTDTLIKITAASKLEEDKKFGIKGFEAKIEICKSRHAPAGRSVTMIYDQLNGFRDDLSKLNYLQANGKLKGNGMAYYIEGLDDKEHKFKMSNFADKLAEDETLRNHFDSVAEAEFMSSIKESRNIVYTEPPVEEKTMEILNEESPIVDSAIDEEEAFEGIGLD